MITVRPQSYGDSGHDPEKEEGVKAWDIVSSIWLLAGSSRCLLELVMRNVIIHAKSQCESHTRLVLKILLRYKILWVKWPKRE